MRTFPRGYAAQQNTRSYYCDKVDFKRPVQQSAMSILGIRGDSPFRIWWNYHHMQSYFLRSRAMGRPHRPTLPQSSLYPIFTGIHYNGFWFMELCYKQGKVNLWVRKAFELRKEELKDSSRYDEKTRRSFIRQIKKLIETPSRKWCEANWVTQGDHQDFVSNYFLGFFKPNDNYNEKFTKMESLRQYYKTFIISAVEDDPIMFYIYDFLYIVPEKFEEIYSRTKLKRLNDYKVLRKKLRKQIKLKLSDPITEMDSPYEAWLLKQTRCENEFNLAWSYSGYTLCKDNFDRILPIPKHFESYANISAANMVFPFYAYSSDPTTTIAATIRKKMETPNHYMDTLASLNTF